MTTTPALLLTTATGRTSDEVLRCEGVGAGYGRVKICRDVSFTLHEGEFLAVLGPNGAGKTTLLNALPGRTQQSGRVWLDGDPLDGRTPHRRARAGLAVVPEHRGNIFPSMTVQENLDVGARNAPADERDALLDEVLELFPRVAMRLKSPAGVLSGGEQQMLAIGMALASRPRVLVLDEPSQGLAPSVLGVVSIALQALRERGTTLLIAEQNHEFAAELVDRVLVLVDGRVVRSGSIKELGGREWLASAFLGVGGH